MRRIAGEVLNDAAAQTRRARLDVPPTSFLDKTLWWAARAGRVVFLLIMTACLGVGVMLGVMTIIDAGEPVVWGTFTESHCEDAGRRGCRSVGTWVSDDGRIRLADVYLDGQPDADGRSRASYQPAGVHNDADLNIVHNAFGTVAEPILSWAITIWLGGVCAFYAMKWRGTWARPWTRAARRRWLLRRSRRAAPALTRAGGRRVRS